MTDYTVIRNSVFRNRSDVVLEVVIPSAPSDQNAAGERWTDVISGLRAANGQTGTTENPYKTSDVAHINNLDAGEIVEASISVSYNANLTEAEKDAIVDAAVQTRAAELWVGDGTGELEKLYQFAGKTRTVT